MWRLAILAGLLVLGCGSDDPPVAPTTVETVTKGEYKITLESENFGNTVLVGETVDTTYDPANSYVFLNTDDNNEPLGTLTMTLGPPYTTGDGDLAMAVFAAVLSKTDVRVGTGAEINAMAYEAGGDIGSTIRNVEIGSNFIRGDLFLVLSRVLVRPEDTPDIAVATGPFTAVSD